MRCARHSDGWSCQWVWANAMVSMIRHWNVGQRWGRCRTYSYPGISTIGDKPAAFARFSKRWSKLTKARQWPERAKCSASAKSSPYEEPRQHIGINGFHASVLAVNRAASKSASRRALPFEDAVIMPAHDATVVGLTGWEATSLKPSCSSIISI